MIAQSSATRRMNDPSELKVLDSILSRALADVVSGKRLDADEIVAHVADTEWSLALVRTQRRVSRNVSADTTRSQGAAVPIPEVVLQGKAAKVDTAEFHRSCQSSLNGASRWISSKVLLSVVSDGKRTCEEIATILADSTTLKLKDRTQGRALAGDTISLEFALEQSAQISTDACGQDPPPQQPKAISLRLSRELRAHSKRVCLAAVRAARQSRDGGTYFATIRKIPKLADTVFIRTQVVDTIQEIVNSEFLIGMLRVQALVRQRLQEVTPPCQCSSTERERQTLLLVESATAGRIRIGAMHVTKSQKFVRATFALADAREVRPMISYGQVMNRFGAMPELNVSVDERRKRLSPGLGISISHDQSFLVGTTLSVDGAAAIHFGVRPKD